MNIYNFLSSNYICRYRKYRPSEFGLGTLKGAKFTFIETIFTTQIFNRIFELQIVFSESPFLESLSQIITIYEPFESGIIKVIKCDEYMNLCTLDRSKLPPDRSRISLSSHKKLNCRKKLKR